QWIRRDVEPFGADSGKGSLGYRCLRARAAVEPQRQSVRASPGRARAPAASAGGEKRFEQSGSRRSEGMIAQDYKAPESVGRLQRSALFVGLVGLVLCIVGWIKSPDVFIRSYLFAFLF